MTCWRRSASPSSGPATGSRRSWRRIALASAAGRTLSRAASRTRGRSTASSSSRSLPVMMRETSRRSEMSCAWERALRSIASSARRVVCSSTLPGAQHLGPAEHGVERRAQLVGEGGEELVLDAVGLLGLLARRLLAHQQARPLLLGPLAHVDLALELLVGARQLGRALAHQVLHLGVHPLEGLLGAVALLAQGHLLDGVLHRPPQVLARDRALEQVVLGAVLHRLHGDRLVALAGHQDHRHQLLPQRAGEELQAVDVGQAVVHQDAVRLLLSGQAQPFFPQVGLQELVAALRILLQEATVQLPVLRAVVDDQDAQGGGAIGVSPPWAGSRPRTSSR